MDIVIIILSKNLNMYYRIILKFLKNEKVNWGIIGGSIANKFADGFSKINNATVKGIASLNKNNLQSFKKNFK